jgi:uncharacterized cupredoxin-like copper-binding protein
MQKSYVPLIIIALLAAAFFVATLAMLVLPIQPPLLSSVQISKTPTLYITLYGGEISQSKFGFGLTPNNLTSPGPSLTFKTTDVVSLTFVNVGQMAHAFAITDSPNYKGKLLFNAAVGSGSNPLSSGQSGTVVFQPNTMGNEYYICSIPGHADSLGMWGTVTITMGPRKT